MLGDRIGARWHRRTMQISTVRQHDFIQGIHLERTEKALGQKLPCTRQVLSEVMEIEHVEISRQHREVRLFRVYRNGVVFENNCKIRGKLKRLQPCPTMAQETPSMSSRDMLRHCMKPCPFVSVQRVMVRGIASMNQGEAPAFRVQLGQNLVASIHRRPARNEQGISLTSRKGRRKNQEIQRVSALHEKDAQPVVHRSRGSRMLECWDSL